MRNANVYRRRRLGALFVVAASSCLLYAGTGAGADVETVAYDVEPGDTLWSIATESYGPSEDPRVKVEEIKEENGLDGNVIQPGVRLMLPS